jgi:AraC family transcriptional regulator of adaptative response / DNA-3-methyladenine glycosylase II
MGVAAGEYVFHLGYRPPYDWGMLLSFLAARAVPGVESLRDGSYRRTLAIQGHHGLLEVRPAQDDDALRVHIRFPEPEHLLQIITRVRAMFDLAADPDVIGRTLGADDTLAPLLQRHAGIRLPGAWDNLEPTVHAILRQSFSLEETRRVQSLLVEECGRPLSSLGAGELCRTYPAARALAESGLAFLPPATAAAIRSAAQAVAAVRSNAPPDDLLRRLRAIEGVAGSAIEYIAMRALNDSDALPAGIPELRSALAGMASTPELLRHAENWKPWRSYAAVLLMGREFRA